MPNSSPMRKEEGSKFFCNRPVGDPSVSIICMVEHLDFDYSASVNNVS